MKNSQNSPERAHPWAGCKHDYWRRQGKSRFMLCFSLLYANDQHQFGGITEWFIFTTFCVLGCRGMHTGSCQWWVRLERAPGWNKWISLHQNHWQQIPLRWPPVYYELVFFRWFKFILTRDDWQFGTLPFGIFRVKFGHNGPWDIS